MNHILQKATCESFSFSCRASQNTFNVRESIPAQLRSLNLHRLQDQTRVRYGIMTTRPSNFHDECQPLMDFLESPQSQF